MYSKSSYLYNLYRFQWVFLYLQTKALIELWRPAVVLGFGLEFALLVAEVRPNYGDLHEGSEHAGRLPF